MSDVSFRIPLALISKSRPIIPWGCLWPGTSKIADYDQVLKLGVGPRFWDQNILSFTRLETVDWIASRVPKLPINVGFMLFSGFGLGFNIVTRCVLPSLVPLPLIGGQLHQRIQSTPRLPGFRGETTAIPSSVSCVCLCAAAFIPFLCAWGLQFAHVVGQMIIAYVTSQPLPVWDTMYIWSIIGAIDANMPFLFGR